MHLGVFESKKVIEFLSEHLLKKDECLPHLVFKKDYEKYGVRDFSVIFTDDFFSLLLLLIRRYQNEEIFMVVTDPDPFEYYLNERNFLPVFKFDANDSPESFLADINHSSDVAFGDLSTIAGTVVLFPFSREWIIYLQRNEDIGILGIDGDNISRLSENIDLFSFRDYGRQEEGWKLTVLNYSIPR